jgi:hypothetical protein
MKHRILLTILAVAAVVFSPGCKKDDYVEVDSVCPIVLATSPANGDVLAPLGKHITATFNEPMEPTSINTTSFTVNGSTAVAGTVSYSGVTATFSPSVNLDSNSTYICKITTQAKDLMGNTLQVNYVWSFSTGAAVAPMVISTDPTNLATSVVLNKSVVVRFSQPMDPLTLTNNTVAIHKNGAPVAGFLTMTDTTTTFVASSPLTANTLYTGTVKVGVKNIWGVALENEYNWSFTTGSVSAPVVLTTDPVDLENNVPLAKVISVTFSENMNQSSLNSSNFILKQGNTVVPGIVTNSNTTATFTPVGNLASGAVYTAILTVGMESQAGVPLANEYVWHFTTLVVAPPLVISTDPTDQASNVPLNKVIRATFNGPMDPQTMNTTNFVVKIGTTPISGAVTYSGNTVSFTPTDNLLSDQSYNATITTGAFNVGGVSLAQDYVWGFNTVPHLGPDDVNLLTAARFGILAATAIDNMVGVSEIHDLDVGISPGVRSSITGFPPAVVINGGLFASDDALPSGTGAMLTQAKQDLTSAYLIARGTVSPTPITVAGDIGGTTLVPGVYTSISTLTIQNGNLTLNAMGDVNAVWIFQIGSDLTTISGAGGNVVLTGGAKPNNIYWQVGSSATLGNDTDFKGNILALTSINLNPGAAVQGRLLARNGSVTLNNTNIIHKP